MPSSYTKIGRVLPKFAQRLPPTSYHRHMPKIIVNTTCVHWLKRSPHEGLEIARGSRHSLSLLIHRTSLDALCVLWRIKYLVIHSKNTLRPNLVVVIAYCKLAMLSYSEKNDVDNSRTMKWWRSYHTSCTHRHTLFIYDFLTILTPSRLFKKGESMDLALR